MRELLVFCDGTNNTLTGGAEETNVVSLYRDLQGQKDIPPGVERLFYYDPGVGSADTLPPTGPVDWIARSVDRAAGLASGKGVYENIASAYLFLMRNWQDTSDRIYLFGFSRGAFTVRCVAGMVNLFGILRPEHEVLLPTLIHTYFSPTDDSGARLRQLTSFLHLKLGRKNKAGAEIGGHPEEKTRIGRSDVANEIRTLFTSPAGRDAWVHWVGVWDTVDSVGLPGPLSRGNPNSATLRGKRIRNVRHALSLDEHRYVFAPRLYNEPGDIADAGQTLKQRWFPGVHCDVGGSYSPSTCGLSDSALAWMRSEVAGDLKLSTATAIATGRTRTARLVRHDPLWDTPFWALTGMVLRKVQDVPVGPAAKHESMTMIQAPLPDGPVASVWQQQRSPWWLAGAVLSGVFAMYVSGYCLLWNNERAVDGFFGSGFAAMGALAGFNLDLSSALWGGGFLADDSLLWLQVGQPGWATFWDLIVLVCWGYALARISSRAFAWLAGVRSVKSPSPAWRWLGMAPLALVASALAMDALTWAALAAHGAGVDGLGKAFTWLAALAWFAKVAGVLACAPLVVLRYWIAFRPSNTFDPVQDSNDRGSWGAKHPRYRSTDLYALSGVAIIATVLWTYARLGICWGTYGVPGAMMCKSHYLVAGMGAFGLFSLAMIFVDLAAPHRQRFADARFARLRSLRQGYRELDRLSTIHVFASALLALGVFIFAAAFAGMSPVLF